MGFSLTYDLEGAGWAMAQIQDGDEKFDITVSYLHDSLRELGEAARALRGGAESARVVFMDEPGEIQLLLTSSESGLDYELRWFDDWNSWGMHPDDKFESVHRGTTTVPRFFGEVLKEFEALLADHGEEGYREKWHESGFPSDLLLQLRNKPKAESGPGE
ncbi:hypothetical protein [Haloferula rosea]|uniref:Uncharacterized protein n=1 Tax=Haloferula rosea TaxID=490093 RepID=A0A934RAS8_9BACT|nr:hypothetical protein [Haloferula rosea]MBK1827587.1 hypothetical protein [Haloferula rosea]